LELALHLRSPRSTPVEYKKEKIELRRRVYLMNKKLSLVGSALALVCLSGASYAETFGNSPKGSIVVVSKQEAFPGYFHEKYVYSHPDCEGNIQVDYYGSEINPNDEELLAKEQQLCAENRWFGDGSGGSDD
jgi:hypothetical protein